MRPLRVLAAAAFAFTACMPGGATASDVFFDDHKLGPPAGCLQHAMGLTSSKEAGPPPTLAGAESALQAGGFDREAAALAGRALALKARVGTDEWARLDAEWSSYASALSTHESARRRSCVGGYLAERSVADLLYVVLAPVWMFSHGPDENIRPARLLIPVAGAVGLATDPLFLVVSPLAKWRLAGRARKAEAARDAFSQAVDGLEKPAP